MFLRFSKGQFDKNNVRKFRKCVFLGGSVVMEYGDEIVGVATLHEETQKSLCYKVVVAKHNELNPQTIARYVKDMIGKSNKFMIKPSKKRGRSRWCVSACLCKYCV